MHCGGRAQTGVDVTRGKPTRGHMSSRASSLHVNVNINPFTGRQKLRNARQYASERALKIWKDFPCSFSLVIASTKTRLPNHIFLIHRTCFYARDRVTFLISRVAES